MRAHHGVMHAVSEEGRGTTVRAYFPALPGSSESDHAITTGVHVRDFAGKTVLFVDDEPAVRSIAELSLKEAGLHVLLAVNGAEALELVRSERERIDVMVLDMTMPVLGGVEAARRLRQMQIAFPIIASSGYSETETMLRFGSAAPEVLRKPYRPEDLLAKVRSALATARTLSQPDASVVEP